MSPFFEAKQATSGRAGEPYSEGEGLGYWRAAALLIGRQQREMASRVDYVSERSGGVARESQEGQAELTTRHASELLEWRWLARDYGDLRGEPLLGRAERQRGLPDALALDFAPSHNFQLDQFEFDSELRSTMRAVRFSTQLHLRAKEAALATFGSEPYLAAHFRRDGYEHYCAGSGLSHYGRLRYGVQVSPEMCFPSVKQAAASLRVALQQHHLRWLLLATNSVDEAELAELNSLVPFKRWAPDSSILDEWVPVVELLLCARAAAFVGTLPSTFSATVLVQRDLLGIARNTTSFFGARGILRGGLA